MNLPKKERYLHSTMCVIGGYFGAYAIMCRAGNLGSAQTMNLIEIVCDLLGHNFFEFFLRVFGAFLYMAAILICLFLQKKTSVNTQKYAIITDALGFILLSFIPEDVPTVVGLFPIFFMAATQWSVFHGLGEYNSSTIFSTNNLRQFTLAIGEYAMERDEKQAKKAKFFGNSLLWFHVGVAVSFFICRKFGIYASLGCLPITLGAFLLACDFGQSEAYQSA